MVKFVTTLSDKDLDTIGKKLFESWSKYSEDITLMVMLNNLNADYGGKYNNINFYKIENEDYYKFVEDFGKLPSARGYDSEGRYNYKRDVTRFCHKIFAIKEGLKYLNKKDSLYIWWDSDAFLTRNIDKKFIIDSLSPFDWLSCYLGRKDWDHSETGFIAFNMKHEKTTQFIDDLVNVYVSRQVFYINGTRVDSTVYDLVRSFYMRKYNINFRNISLGKSGLDVWKETFLSNFSVHNKGFEQKAKEGIIPHEFKQNNSEDVMMEEKLKEKNINSSKVRFSNRYDQIYALIDKFRPKIITEIGVAAGDRAEGMIRRVFKYSDTCVYFGFDLFEDITDEIAKQEMNAKKVLSMKQIHERLRQIQREHPGLFFTLYKGNTREILKKYVNEEIELANERGEIIKTKPSLSDLVFIDGGHSVETIRNDWSYFKNNNLIILDDYYESDNNGICPDVSKFGCNFLVNELSDYRLLPVRNAVKGGGFVRLMVTGKNLEEINKIFM